LPIDIKQEFPPFVQDYVLYQRQVKNLSLSTVTEYCFDLRTFFRFMKRHKASVPEDLPLEEIPIDDITVDWVASIKTYDIYAFLSFIIDERSNLAAARQRKSSALRSFFTYLSVHEKLLKENPTEGLLSPKKKISLPRYLSVEQSIELLQAVQGETRERDLCMMVLFLNCGMRLSELVGINLSDVKNGQNQIKIVGKGQKERLVYLNEACKIAISAYLKVRPADGVVDREALFLSGRKKRISPKTVQHIVKKYLTMIGLPDYSVHKLRHTAATLMYQKGNADILVIQKILGHENLSTTEIYTHTSDVQMQQAVSANPLAQFNAANKKKIEDSTEEAITALKE